MSACSAEWNDVLSAWLDGEAAPGDQARVQEHLNGCRTCAAAAEQLRALGNALRSSATVELPPRVVERARRLAEPARVSRRRLFGLPALGVAAALLLVFGLLPGDSNQALANELSAIHYRAFSSTSPCEFTSSDPVAVKAWLSEKVGYSVTVPQLPGATLLGARRCRVAGTMTAALLYREDGQALTIFMPRSDTKAAQEACSLAGSTASCRKGKLGEEICVTRCGSTALAGVADLAPERLLAILEDVSHS